jgi:hypothetical protein
MAAIRPRHAKEPFEIHHDETEESMEQEELEDSKIEEGEDMEVDGYSEASDDTDEVVEDSVQEDMDRFEETFQDMKDRFRLINRIGEGKLFQFPRGSLTDPSQAPFRPCTRQKISCTMRTITTGISRKRKTRSGHPRL